MNDGIYCETGDYWKKLSSTTNPLAKTTNVLESEKCRYRETEKYLFQYWSKYVWQCVLWNRWLLEEIVLHHQLSSKNNKISFDEYDNIMYITFVLFMIWTFLLCWISIYFQRYSFNKYSQCIRASINQTMRQWR